MQSIDSQKIELLAMSAINTRKNAFSFKSGHSIGAAVLTNTGEIFEGCNVEGVISSLGVCAEMAAVDHAVLHGRYSIVAVAVADDDFTFPCGACLQYLTQFSQVDDTDITIIAVKMNGEKVGKKLSELLPNKFISKSFDSKIKEFSKR